MDNGKLKPGQWLVSDCGKYPSENSCKMVIAAPADQRQHFMNAVVDHAGRVHGEKDTPQFRSNLEKTIEEVTVE